MNHNFLSKILAVLLITFPLLSIHAQNDSEAKVLYEQGVRFGKAGNFEEALKILRQALKIAPENPEIHNAMGVAFIGLRKLDNAIESYRKSLRFFSAQNRDSADVRRNLCIALVYDEKIVEALAECRQAVRLMPEEAINHWQLAQTLRAVGQIDEGIKTAQTALQKFPNDEKLLTFLAGSYAIKGDFAEELKILEKVVRLNPKVSSYRVLLSESYLRLDRVEEAAEAARQAIELDALNPFAYYRLARVYDEIGMNEEVLAALRKAVELQPDAGEIYFLFGKNLAKIGNAAQAIVNLREAVRLLPQNSLAHFLLGETLIEDARFAEAVTPLRRANQLKSNDIDIKTALGTALLESGSYDEALLYLREADELRPANQIMQMLLGVAQARKQGIAEIEKVKRRVAAVPADIEAKKYLAQLYLYTGDIEAAERLNLEAFSLAPETFESNNRMAVFYTDTRRFDISIKYLRRAIELKPHHVLYLSLAANLQKLGRRDEALDAYGKALEIKPDSVNVLKFYADALRDAGKRSEAVRVYERVLQFDSRNAPVLFNLSLLSLKLLDRENARRYYERLVLVEPKLAKNLAWIFRLLK